MDNLLLTGAAWFDNLLNGLFLFIDGIIYYFVALTYKVFFVVSKANLFGDAELKIITDRVFTVLGVFMLFVFAYNIIMLIAYPDNLAGKDDKSLNSLWKNMLISIVILTLLPTIFNYLKQIQDSVLESNVIGNMILGGWSDSEVGYSISEAGTSTALLILGAFYHPVVDGVEVSATDCKELIADGTQGPKDICTVYVEAYESAQKNMRIRDFTFNGTLIDNIHKGNMKYTPLISTAAGIFAAYLFISFALDVGARMAKLAFLQLISPVPVIFRITKPKGGTFDRWMKEMTTTFFAIFIRLAFIFFSMYAITLVPIVLKTLWTGGDGSLGFGVLGLEALVIPVANVIIILGILSFAKSGPKMMEDLFAIEHLNVNIKKKLDDNTLAMRGIAGIGAGASQFAGNVYTGFKKDPVTGKRDIAKGTLGAVSGLVGGVRRGIQHGGVNDISKLGGAINTARQDTEAARTDRKKIYAHPVKEFGEFVRGIGSDIGDFVVGGGATPESLKAAKELKDAMGRLTSGLEGLAGGKLKSLESGANEARKKMAEFGSAQFQGVTYTSAGALNDAIDAATDTLIKDKANDPVGQGIVTRTSDTILKQLNGTLAALGSESQSQIITHLNDISTKRISMGQSAITNVTEMEAALKEFSAHAEAGTATDLDWETFRTISKAISNQVIGQEAAVRENQAKKDEKK